jgi:hemolysin D
MADFADSKVPPEYRRPLWSVFTGWFSHARSFIGGGLDTLWKNVGKKKNEDSGLSNGRPSAPMLPEDREFLPAALEIVESPPSPVSIAFIWAICTVFIVALAWSYFGRMDIYAIAPGKIQPSGQSKVIQPLEPGKVASVLVEDGSRVEAGALLVELDPTETAADQEEHSRELEAAKAETARRTAAIEAAISGSSERVPIKFDQQTGQRIRQREQEVLAADLAQLTANLDALKAQMAQQRATIRRLSDNIEGRERLIALTKELVDMRQTLQSKGGSSRALVIEALEKYESEMGNQLGEQGQLRETRAALEATEKKSVETVMQFIADQSQKLADADRKSDQLSQELIKARTKNERTRLTAPVSGIVQQLDVTTVGQVVSSGQALMTIVPPDAPLEVEAMIPNKDVGFVRVGQRAVVKVEAFPFTRYGSIDGTVDKVSADAVDVHTAPNLSEASAMVKNQGATPVQSPNGPELAFPATIALAQYAIDADGQEVHLRPGMTVSVEILTGRRRIIDYVMSPLREMVSGAAHER